MVRYQFSADVKAYIEHLRPHLSESTLKDKHRKLRLISRNFTELYEEKKVSTNNPRRLTVDDVVAYVAFRRSEKIAESTISKDLCALGSLLSWLGNRVIEEFRALGSIYKPHSYTGRKPPMPRNLIERIIELSRKTNDWRILRGCTMVLLCAAGGLRSQEARKLYAPDVTMVNGHMIVHIEHVKGEGRYADPRNVLIVGGVEDIILRYLDSRVEKLREAGKESRAMFPPLNNDSEFYSQQAFCSLKKCVEEELGEKFDLRSARRAFGQFLLDCGNRIEDVSVAMGHSSTKTTEGYYARNREEQVMDRILQNQADRQSKNH